MSTYWDDPADYSEGDVATEAAANWSVVTLSGSWSVVVDSTGGPSSEPAFVWDHGASGDANAHARYDTAGTTSGDIEVYARVSLDGGFDPNVGFGPMLMQTDNAAYGLAANSATVVRLLRFSASGGAAAFVGGTLTLTLSAGTLYHCIVGRTGTTVYAYIWPDGGSQSGSPDISGTDTALTTIGPAMFARDFSMMPQRMTAFGVGTAGDSAPQADPGGGGGGEILLPTFAVRQNTLLRM